MEHGKATELARRMIAKMGDPSGRYRELESATGLKYSTLKVITHRMRNSGEIPLKDASEKTMTDNARKMLLERVGDDCQYVDIATRSGLAEHSVRSLVAQMRRAGIIPPAAKACCEYVGTSERLGVVRFKSLSKASQEGFSSRMVSKAANGLIESYAGYNWERVYP